MVLNTKHKDKTLTECVIINKNFSYIKNEIQIISPKLNVHRTVRPIPNMRIVTPLVEWVMAQCILGLIQQYQWTENRTRVLISMIHTSYTYQATKHTWHEQISSTETKFNWGGVRQTPSVSPLEPIRNMYLFKEELKHQRNKPCAHTFSLQCSLSVLTSGSPEVTFYYIVSSE